MICLLTRQIEELAPFGNLCEYLKKEGEKSTLKQLHTFASQLADAMAYLEDKKIVHCDLAARNLLLTRVDVVSGPVKVIVHRWD